MKIGAIALNTFREALRNKVLYSVIFFAIILTAISAFFGTVTIGEREKVIKDFGLFSLSFFGAIITILSGVSLLNKELKQRTVYNILSKPVARWEFIVGKHLGLTATVYTLVIAMGLSLMVFVSLFEGRVDWLLLQGIGFALLEVTIVSALSMFFSSLVVTTTLSGLFTLGAYLAGRSISYLQYFLSQDEDTNGAIILVVKACDAILPDLSLFNMSDSIVAGTIISGSHALHAVLYAVGYSAATLCLAAMIFQKRELV